ncbi:MAG: hypothetical protein JW864_09880 [Spirochaetes bacterium]|nr:hypothetical protein [Spirochaetota bacterium]
MAEINYDKLIARFPDGEVCPAIMNRQIPSMTVISDKLFPGANHYQEGGWIYNMPEPNPGVFEMVHKKYDEIVMMIGSNPDDPEYLGAEVDFYVAGQPVLLNKTRAMFVPKGIPHGPMHYKKFVDQWPHIKPHLMSGLMLNVGNLMDAWGDSGVAEAKKEFPVKDPNDTKDYSLFSPKENTYDVFQGLKNRKTITLMSSDQVPEAYSFMKLTWVTGIPETDHREHAHDYDELLINLGGNPFSPHDLGADIEFEMGGKTYELNSTSSVWLPKGVKIDKMKWKNFRHPHIELSIIMNCGDKRKIWGDDI